MPRTSRPPAALANATRVCRNRFGVDDGVLPVEVDHLGVLGHGSKRDQVALVVPRHARPEVAAEDVLGDRMPIEPRAHLAEILRRVQPRHDLAVPEGTVPVRRSHDVLERRVLGVVVDAPGRTGFHDADDLRLVVPRLRMKVRVEHIGAGHRMRRDLTPDHGRTIARAQEGAPVGPSRNAACAPAMP
jgi:hypothetical protein